MIFGSVTKALFGSASGGAGRAARFPGPTPVSGLFGRVTTGGAVELQEDLEQFGLQTAGQLRAFSFEGARERAVRLLEELELPRERTERGRIRSRLLGQGTLGLATGEEFASPELLAFERASQEAGIARTLRAQQFATAEQERLLGGIGALSQLEANLLSASAAFSQIAQSARTAEATIKQKGAQADAEISANFFNNIVESASGFFGSILS